MKQQTKRSIAIAAMLISLMLPAVFAQTEPDRLDQLAEQVAQLRAENISVKQKLIQLQAQRGDAWLNERRAEEVKTLIADVLADADTRVSLLQDGMTAGHNGKNFFLASAYGSFLLKIKGQGQVQFRYIWNSCEQSTSTDIDENEAGFTIRRTKLAFEGHIASPKIGYAIQLAVRRDNNSVIADKIVISYKLSDSFTLWAGEDKATFSREELTSSKNQLAVERSSLHDAFTVDKAQGIGFKWNVSDMLKLAAMINDGAHSGDVSALLSYSRLKFRSDTSFIGDKDFDADQVEFAFTARADVKLKGDWKQIKDFTAWHGQPTGIFLGAGIHYQKGEVGDDAAPRGGNDEITVWTIDGSLETNGFNLFVAYFGATTDIDTTGASLDADPWGIQVQGGYQIPDIGPGILEPFVRWEFIDIDDLAAAGSESELNILTVGANYYFNKHAAKFTIDFVIGLDELTDHPGISSGAGILGKTGSGTTAEDGEIALRTQYQLLF